MINIFKSSAVKNIMPLASLAAKIHSVYLVCAARYVAAPFAPIVQIFSMWCRTKIKLRNINNVLVYLIFGIQFLLNRFRFQTFLVLFSDTAPFFSPHHKQCLSCFVSIGISTFLQHISPISYVSFTFVQGRNNFSKFTFEIISALLFLINLTKNYERVV